MDSENLYLYSLRKMAESNIEQNRIPLTNLMNLRAFLYKADDLIRYNNEKYAIIVMDIAGFKMVNEFCSRETGDKLLVFISDCLRSYENDKTVAAHFRADIFALCTPYQTEDDLVEIVNDLSERIRAFPIACKVMPAFGICTAQGKELSASYIQDYAFIAQKTVKGKYFTNYAFFDNTMRDKMLLEKRIENGFDEALATNQFRLYIQPKVQMDTGQIFAGEALVRWLHPVEGLISPAAFLPVLEKNASIIAMDKYIWKKTFRFVSEMRCDYGIDIPVSINISRIHAYDDTLVETLINLSVGYQVPPHLIPLELTESAYSENEEIMYDKIKALKDYGFFLSMDDFGSGYSTLNMLVERPVDEVKFDRGFLFHLENPKYRTLLSHTIHMLHDLGLPIIIEGVETESQKNLLLEWGCKQAQGFLFYKPMPVEDFKELLIKQTKQEQ
ncbi:MAG: EAL domain-containing protein [Lachnospiraceae bacterium]|nr:EAL domain-containing protein [Lachnospiraceae bacterium]